jgi:hypothetical protein
LLSSGLACYLRNFRPAVASIAAMPIVGAGLGRVFERYGLAGTPHYRREKSAVRLCPFRCSWYTPLLRQTAKPIMQAIRAIVDTYVRLRNEDALLASKQQRLRVLAMCDAGNPMFERLRSQCLEEIAEIEAGLERLRPAPLLPDPPPSLPQLEEARDPAPALPDPPPSPPQAEAAIDLAPSLPANGSSSARAVEEPTVSPTPIDPSPFLAVEELPAVAASASSPIPVEGDPPSAPIGPPQFLTAVSPSLLASTILAGSISTKLPASGAKPEAELMRLQIALEQRMRSQR